MRSLFLIAAVVAVAFAADGDVENWKVTACQRTNGHLSFCGDLGLSGDAVKDNSVRPLPRVQPVQPTVPVNNEIIRTFPAIENRGGRVPDARCYEYQDRFYHYCFNVTEQPQNIRASLRNSCTKYRSACRGFITTPNPIEGLPNITDPPPYVPSPCYHNCTEDHCTKRCKCDHYKPGWERTCKEDVMMPLWQQNCQIWHAACKEFYAIPPGYYTGKRVGALGAVDNTHTGFWEDKTEVDVDWAEGQVKTGDVWGVPAVGISGATDVTDIRFPAALAGIGFGQLGRKKRSILEIMRVKRGFGKQTKIMKRDAFENWNHAVFLD